jgi:hypothetical protein
VLPIVGPRAGRRIVDTEDDAHPGTLGLYADPLCTQGQLLCAAADDDPAGARDSRGVTGTTTGTSDRAPLVEMVFASMAGKVVSAAAELGIADLLADGARSSAELAERAGAHAPSLHRLMRALAGLGAVTHRGTDHFELTEYGSGLRADHPSSVRTGAMMLSGPENWAAWSELVPSVRAGGRAFERAHGVPVFDFYARHPERAATFDAAMAEHTRDAAPAIVARAEFSRFGTVTDVGGGDGTLMAQILGAHREVEGVVFDLEQGLGATRETLAAAGVAGRCRIVAGDMFDAVPEGADAYVLKQVLHDFDDARAAAILRNCRAAMGPGARLVVLERVLPERVGPEDARTALLDVLMLVVTGGRERTEDEFRGLFSEAGLAVTEISEPLEPFGYRVIEATQSAGGQGARTRLRVRSSPA